MAAHCGHRGDTGGNIPFHRDAKLSLHTLGCSMVTQRWYRHFLATLGSGEEDRITVSVNASDVIHNCGKKGGMDCRDSVGGIKMESQTSRGTQNLLDELGNSS